MFISPILFLFAPIYPHNGLIASLLRFPRELIQELNSFLLIFTCTFLFNVFFSELADYRVMFYMKIKCSFFAARAEHIILLTRINETFLVSMSFCVH